MSEEIVPSGVEWIGGIPSSWVVSPFKYCASIDNGYPADSAFFNTKGVGIPLLRIRDITSGQTDTWYSGSYPAALVVRSGDVLIGMDGDFNLRVWDGPDALLNQRCCRIKGVYLDTRFLAYCLEFPLRRINDLTVSTTVKHLLVPDIESILLPVPSREEQRRIVRYLDELCGSITLSVSSIERQIDLLERYRSSVIHEAVTKGLDPSVPMKPSGAEWIGDIPSNWSVNRLRYLASFESGATPSKDNLEFWEGTIPWVSSQEVKEDILLDTSLHITAAAISSCSTRILPEGTLVMVVRSGILQHTIPVALLGRPMTINQDIKALRFDGGMQNKYFFYLVKGNNDNLLKELIKDKSTVDNISFEYLLSLHVPVPPPDEQQSIINYLDKRCSVIDAVIDTKRKQRDVLKKRRQSLIYEYVTGKRRVGTKG